MFDRSTIDYGRISWDRSRVSVYMNYNNCRSLSLPCGNVIDARWVGQTVQVTMDSGWTYVYDGFGSYKNRWPSK